MRDNDLSFQGHAKALAKLAWPLIGSQVAQFAIGLTDAVMLGWYDLEAFAAQVLGGSFFFIVLILGSGFAFGLSPLVASAAAQDDQTQIRRTTRMSFWLVTIYAVVTIPLLMISEPILLAAGQDPVLSGAADEYLRIMGWSILPALFVMVLRSYLSSLEQAGIILYMTLASLILNAGINYLLIFGSFGFPEMGLKGAAIASLSVHTFSFIVLILYALHKNRHHSLLQRFWRPDWEAFAEVFRVGWPIGVTVLAEVGLFTAASVMVGWVGVVELGAHGITLQLASLAFMFHLGLSHAVTVRSGQAYGRNDQVGLRRGAAVAILMSFGFAVIACVLFFAIPETLLKAFISPDEPNLEAVLLKGTTLLYIAAGFQLADAMQVIGVGLLRGLHDTKVPMYFATFSYWVIGVPTGYIFGFTLNWGAEGVWMGLVTGLIAAAFLMIGRFLILVRRPQAAT